MIKLNELNEKRITNVFAILSLLYLNLLLISIFAEYFYTSLSLTNPLLPESLINIVFEPYAKKGLIISLGFPIVLLLKFAKKNLLAILGVIFIVALYFSVNHVIEFPKVK